MLMLDENEEENSALNGQKETQKRTSRGENAR